MIRRVTRPLSNLTSRRCFNPPKSSPTRLINFSTTSASSQGNLQGLIDSDFVVAGDQELPQKASPCVEDFGFLRDCIGLESNLGNLDRKGFDCEVRFSEDAVLIANSIASSGDGFGESTLKFVRQFRAKLSDVLVIEVLKLVKSCELGVKFFVWAGQQIGYRHSERAYDALIEILGCNENRRVPEHFLREIRDSDREILRVLLNVLIRKCCQNGFWNAALEELGRLKDFGYKPSKSTYNALLLVLLKASRLDAAYLVHREMLSLGLNMDRFSRGCFVHSLCKAGRLDEAFKIIENEELKPDTVIYTKIISGLCEASLFEEAMDVLHRMRSNSCIPNSVTYNTLLSWCLRKRLLGRCKRIINMMIGEGCYPSPSMFISLVNAFCISGDYIYVYKLLKKMPSCNCKPGYVVYNILIGGICGNKDPPSPESLELAEKVYGEMHNAGFMLNKINVSHFARCLCGAGKFHEAYRVVHEMMRKGFIPDTSTYTKVIEYLCQASQMEKAFLLFQEMKESGTIPDVYTYTALIDSFVKVDLIQPARNLFDEMISSGCLPNVVTYTSLIHAYLKSRKVSNANELFEKMLEADCIPNVVTYSALIDGHCKAGDIDKACRIYSRMKGDRDVPDVEVYFKSDGSNQTEPNIYTFGALVDGLCKAHKVAEARELLDVMAAAGCKPNNVVFDALIDGFCKVGKLDEAQDVFAKMSQCGFDPDVYTFNSLIDRLFKDKRLDLALKVLSKMLESSCTPNVVTYTEMIDGLCKVGKTDEAFKLLVMMEEKGCHPNVVTYTAIIDGFGKMGDIDMCLELFQRMGANGCAPNFITYRVLINHCCAAGLLDVAHKLLEEMKQTYWPMNMASYRKVIEGFKKEFIISLGILDEISKDVSSPVIPAYRILIDSFCKAERLEMALELHREIVTSLGHSAVSKNMYSSLIESLCLAFKVEKAFELYGDMTRQGFVPELTTFFHLIKGLIRISKWVEALQFSHALCHMGIHWHPKNEESDET
ncbi:hypothetical protein Scep_022130 [Stephania cephalantha]|uniref:Pentatricopeptide repeat-containing protein n=1 Tax=Stephania cephalantha TaxID=152367 RepID=A0AAP0I1X8_9MAGN